MLARACFVFVLIFAVVGGAHAQIGSGIFRSVPGPTGCAALSGLSATPSNGWSLGRKLNSSYGGNAATLVLTGGSTQAIGFVNGCFDTAAAVTFCTTACHVLVLNDQFGSVDFTFASFATAPLYTASCINLKPCADNTGGPGVGNSAGTNDLAFTGNFAYGAVILDNSGSPEGGYFGNVLTSGAFPGLYFGPSTQIAQFALSAYTNGNWGNCGGGGLTVVDNIIHLVSISRATTTITCAKDGSTATQTGAASSVTGTTATLFGGIGGGTYTGKFSEGVAWNGSSDLFTYRTSTQSFWATQ